MRQKRVFMLILAALAIMLLILPFTLSINDILTKEVEKLGWQSLFLFLLSLFFGFKAGSYTFFSKAEAILIGLLGTFLINLLRIVLTVVLLVVSRPLYAIVFHDYLAAIMTIVWLVVFWWFSYSFVLEDRGIREIREMRGIGGENEEKSRL